MGQDRTELLLLMVPWEKKGEIKEGEAFFDGCLFTPWFYSTTSGTIVSPFTAPLAPLGIRVSERSNRPRSLALGVNTKHCKEGQTIPRHLCLRAMMNCHISSSKPLSSRPPQLPGDSCNIQFTLFVLIPDGMQSSHIYPMDALQCR